MLGRDDYKREKIIHKGTTTKPREVQVIEEHDLDSTISFGLHCLFRHQRFLPHNPYKIITSILRRKERIGDLPPRKAYHDLPLHRPFHERIETMSFQSFHKSSKCVSLQHNHKIFSSTDIDYIDSITKSIHENLGNLSLQTKKGQMESHFIEVVMNCGGYDGGCSGSLLSPHPHVLEMIVEGIFLGPTLDDCLLSFIRRVFEEIDAGKRNQNIICSNCRVEEVNGNVSLFSLDDIRNRKQLVLTTLKAGVIEGGEISVQMFIRMTRHLPSNIAFPDHAHLLCSELSTGFIQVHRKYHFTYVDSTTLPPPIPEAKVIPSHMENLTSSPLNSTSVILIRCFSPLPVDSLMRGVFLSIEAAEKYRTICLRHSRAVEKHQSFGKEKDSSFFGKLWGGGNSQQDDSYYLQREELVVEQILTYYSKMALEALEVSDFVQSGRWLMWIQAILTTSGDGRTQHHHERSKSKRFKQSHTSLYDHSSHCMKQIAAISGQSIGKLHSIREMIDSFLCCIRLYLSDYVDSSPHFTSVVESKKRMERSLTTGPSAVNLQENQPVFGREDVFVQYESICLYLLEVKNILYSLYRDRDAYNSSEILLILPGFLEIIDGLFHETNVLQSILPTVSRLKQLPIPMIPSEIMKSLRALVEPLTHISLGLQFLCCSLGGDLLLELLQMDLDSKYDYDTPIQSVVKLSSQNVFEGGNEVLISTPPLIFSELLGYCQARIAGKPTEGRPYLYGSYHPGPITRFVLDRDTSDYGKKDDDINATKFFNLNFQEYPPLEELVVSTLPTMKKMNTDFQFDLIDLIAGLSFSWIGRLPSIDLLSCHKDELKSYCELPPAVALEGTKLRYLMEMKFEDILYESYLESCTAPERINTYGSFNSIFSKGSSLNQLWKYSDDEMMNNLLKYKDGRVRSLARIVNSKSYLFSKILITNKDTRGGLYGPRLVLQHICRDWEAILSNMWCIPPFLPRLPSQGINGITVEIMSGLSVETALNWGYSHSNSIFFPQTRAKKPLPKEKPFEKLILQPSQNTIFNHSLYPESDDDGEEDESEAKSIPLPQEYPWNIISLGKIEMEVVYKYSHDIPAQTASIRELFAMEIENSIQFMNSSSNWSINQIRIPVSSTSSPDDSKIFLYPITRLRGGDENTLMGFRKRVGKIGLCWIDGAVLLSEPAYNNSSTFSSTSSSSRPEKSNKLNGKHGILRFDQFLNVGKSSENDEEEEEEEEEDDKGDDEEGETNENEEDEKKRSQRQQRQEKKSDTNLSQGKWKNKNKNKEKEKEKEKGKIKSPRVSRSSSDWLGSEIERIVYDLMTSHEIKQLLQHHTKVFIPITLRINLLSWIRGLDIPSAAAEKITSRNIPMLHNETKKLTIGKSETIARLACSTIWMTEEGAIQLWGCCKHQHSMIYCYQYESKRHLLYAKQFSKKGKYLEAYERLFLAMLMSQQALHLLSSIPSTVSIESIPLSSTPFQRLTSQRMLPNVLRMRYGLPGIIQEIIQSISVVKFLFQSGTSDGKGFTSINPLGLAYTIVRHIAYKIRLLVMSSQCVHHPGGSALILLKLKQLEDILHLGQLKLLNMKPINPSHSIKKLQKIVKSDNPLPILLPEYSSVPSSSVSSYSSSLSQIEYEFSQSLSSPAVVIHNRPHVILSEMESYLNWFALSLSKDVHLNAIRENEDLAAVLESKELDYSLQIIINQILSITRGGGVGGGGSQLHLHSQQPHLTSSGIVASLSGVSQIDLRGGHETAPMLSEVDSVNSMSSLLGSTQDESEIRKLNSHAVSSRERGGGGGGGGGGQGRNRGGREGEEEEEERLLTGLSVSSVLSMNEEDFLDSNVMNSYTHSVRSNSITTISTTPNGGPANEQQPVTVIKKRLDPEELEDRMIALTFHREGIHHQRQRSQRSQEAHSRERRGVNIFTVNYDDQEENEEDQDEDGLSIRTGTSSLRSLPRARGGLAAAPVGARGGGTATTRQLNGNKDLWNQLKSMNKKATILEALRRR